MKHYLIDSENVGDFWIPLLEIPADQAELIVFYTKNSPHMSYDSLIRLKESDRKVIFIKCYEGTNALDFQLCSELGYCIARNENDDFIIVTNDTGYDAAVKYWRRKEYSVKRIAGKDSRTGSRRRGSTARSDVAAEVSSILSRLAKASDPDEAHQEKNIRGTAADSGIFAEEESGHDNRENLSGSDCLHLFQRLCERRYGGGFYYFFRRCCADGRISGGAGRSLRGSFRGCRAHGFPGAAGTKAAGDSRLCMRRGESCRHLYAAGARTGSGSC